MFKPGYTQVTQGIKQIIYHWDMSISKPVLSVSRGRIIFSPLLANLCSFSLLNLLLENRCLIKLLLDLQNPVIGKGAARMERCGDFWVEMELCQDLTTIILYIFLPQAVSINHPSPDSVFLQELWSDFVPYTTTSGTHWLVLCWGKAFSCFVLPLI